MNKVWVYRDDKGQAKVSLSWGEAKHVPDKDVLVYTVAPSLAEAITGLLDRVAYQAAHEQRLTDWGNDLRARWLKLSQILKEAFEFEVGELDQADWDALRAKAIEENKDRLQVWYGSMPESNGRSNFTAILHRGDITSGFTVARSEYPDRVRYEADRVRWLIGEIEKEPWILDYDTDKHSGYSR